MDVKDFTRLPIKDGRNKDSTFQPLVSLSRTEQLLRSFGKNPAPEQEERVNPRHLVRSTEKRAQKFWNCGIKYFVPKLLPSKEWYTPREFHRERLSGRNGTEAEKNMEAWLMSLTYWHWKWWNTSKYKCHDKCISLLNIITRNVIRFPHWMGSVLHFHEIILSP